MVPGAPEYSASTLPNRYPVAEELLVMLTFQ
jgi:hypothetical protein